MAESWFKRNVLQRLEAAPVIALYKGLGILPPDWSSGFVAKLARFVGPFLPHTKQMHWNLSLAMPELDEAERKRIVLQAWETMGATIGEFPHMSWLCKGEGVSRFELEGEEHLLALKDQDCPVMFFSAHLGNWEASMMAESLINKPIGAIYRKADNPFVEALYQEARSHISGELIPKGASGARQLTKAMRQKKLVGALLDQKMNDGIAVPFFGRKAMTAPGAAYMCVKYGAMLMPAQVIRKGGTYFKIIFHPPMDIPRTGDVHADVLDIMTRVNLMIEDWIRQNPGQWFWMHRRWPESKDWKRKKKG